MRLVPLHVADSVARLGVPCEGCLIIGTAVSVVVARVSTSFSVTCVTRAFPSRYAEVIKVCCLQQGEFCNST